MKSPHARQAHVLASILISLPAVSYGSGFSISEQSVSGLGNAYAGGAARHDDASVVWSNPAAMTDAQTTEFNVGAHWLSSQVRASPQAGMRSACLTATACQPAGNYGVNALSVVMPNAYVVMPVNQKLRVGLGISSPFGLQTSYSNNWAGRYQAVDAEIKTLNVNPSIAYAVTDKLSLGAGVSAQYLKASLSNELNYAAVIAQSSPSTAVTLLNFGVPLDGLVTIKGHDIGFGANAGAWFHPTEQTQLGLHYRSSIQYHLKGQAEFQHPRTGVPSLDAALTTNPQLGNSGAMVDLKMPASANFSVSHQFTPNVQGMMDVGWTGWHVLKELNIYRSDGTLLSNTSYQWKDTWRVSVGANYDLNEHWRLRAGLAYDQSPIKTAYRTARLPDADRYWLTVGSRFKIDEKSSLDFGYAYVKFKPARIEQRTEGSTAQTGVLDADIRSKIHILSLGFNFKF